MNAREAISEAQPSVLVLLDWLYRPYLWQVSPSAISDDVPSDILDESNTAD